jgi:XTP/dITP diphosphohydrolase
MLPSRRPRKARESSVDLAAVLLAPIRRTISPPSEFRSSSSDSQRLAMSTSQTVFDPFVLVLGSRNRKKCQEMAELIAPAWEGPSRTALLEIRSLGEFPAAPEVIEDAASFAGNARKKASELAVALGQWVLADDSGLTVDALNGAPGVMSARYAGQPCDDAANNRKLLEAMADIPDDRRGAAFVCALAIADPSGAIRLEAEGACRGRITRDLRGTGGFGYDPLFLIVEYHRTFGELSPLVKHHLSHRSRAFAHLRPGLQRLIGDRAQAGS